MSDRQERKRGKCAIVNVVIVKCAIVNVGPSKHAFLDSQAIILSQLLVCQLCNVFPYSCFSLSAGSWVLSKSLFLTNIWATR